jgi:hypothetical protein
VIKDESPEKTAKSARIAKKYQRKIYGIRAIRGFFERFKDG